MKTLNAATHAAASHAGAFATALVAGLLLSGAAYAHHSFAMFDFEKTATVEGEVVKFEFTNPHIWIYIRGKDVATGKVAEYAIEGGSPNALLRAGWKRDSVKAGAKALVSIHPLKSGEPGGSLIGIEIDGKPIAGAAVRQKL